MSGNARRLVANTRALVAMIIRCLLEDSGALSDASYKVKKRRYCAH